MKGTSIAIALAVMSLPPMCSGADVILTAQENLANFGYNDQNNAAINNGPVACAPTATVNSFEYLQSTYPNIPGIANLVGNPITTINTLEGARYMNLNPASGVSAQNLVAGKEQWISDQGLSGQLTVEGQASDALTADNAGTLPGMSNTIPTAAFLYNQLNAGQDVELGFLWWNPALNSGRGGYAGGHVITATGITYDQTTGTAVSINFIDPWGHINLTGAVTQHNGYMELSYSGGAASAGSDPDDPDHVSQGDIAIIAAESPVPEPTAAAILVLSAVALMRRRDRTV